MQKQNVQNNRIWPSNYPAGFYQVTERLTHAIKVVELKSDGYFYYAGCSNAFGVERFSQILPWEPIEDEIELPLSSLS